jgi:hypothetical protein
MVSLSYTDESQRGIHVDSPHDSLLQKKIQGSREFPVDVLLFMIDKLLCLGFAERFKIPPGDRRPQSRSDRDFITGRESLGRCEQLPNSPQPSNVIELT